MSAGYASPLLRTSALRGRGMTAAQIERAVASGDLWRVVRGWYAEPGTDPELIRAMRLGGRLGCVSALRLHGAWTPPDAGMHLAMPTSASGRRLRDSRELVDVTVHWRSKVGQQEWRAGVSSVPNALAHAVECQPPHLAVAVLDSAVRRRLVSRSVVLALLRSLPARHRPIAEFLDGRCEEGIESITRYRLATAGIQAEPQVVVDGVGRIDLLIDGWLAIELDGREHHAQELAFSRDRRRDALLAQHGFSLLHFSYSHVLYDWPLVQASIESVLQRR